MIHQQYTWTVLPQGFRDSPHLFARVLEKDLRDLQLEGGAILQYVDDILICSPSKEASDQNTIQTLNFLAERGYRVSKKKAQITKQKVNYLGYILTPGCRQLSQERIKAITELTPPATKQQLRSFLGMAGFCRIWIPNFGLIAKPLYEAIKGPDTEPIIWEKECDQAFNKIKQALIEAPALGIPNLSKPFSLYIAEKPGIALGVLVQ